MKVEMKSGKDTKTGLQEELDQRNVEESEIQEKQRHIYPENKNEKLKYNTKNTKGKCGVLLGRAKKHGTKYCIFDVKKKKKTRNRN